MMRGQDPDREVWRRAQQGDRAAFDLLRRKYQSLVGAEIRKWVRDISAADRDDVAQQVWLAVWGALPGFRGDSTFATWVGGVVKNKVFEWLRARKSAEQGMAEVVPEEDCREPDWEDRVVKSLVLHEAMRHLSPNERAVIYLRGILQLTDEETARRLGLPPGTVKSRIRSGLRKLQAILRDAFDEETGKW